MSKVFVIVRFRFALAPGTICPKFMFPGPKSNPMFSPAINFVGIACLFNGAFRNMIRTINADAASDINMLFLLFIFFV